MWTYLGALPRRVVLCGIALAFGVLAQCARAKEWFIVHDGKPEARIYLPRAPGKATMFAARELSDHLEKMTGARVPVDLYGSGERRYIVPDEAIVRLEVVADPEGAEVSDVVVDVCTITERGRELTIQGNSDVAVLYGVYEYLHDKGVRWFMPGEIGEEIPQIGEVKIGRSTRTFRPSFRRRELDYSGTNSTHFHPDAQEQQHREYDLWLMRNRCQFSRSIHWGYLHRFDFNWTRDRTNHNVAAILRRADIAEEPERFALVTRDGETRRRPPRERVQICFTHPRNVEATVEAAVAWFAQNPDKFTYPTSLQDCGGICECRGCTVANAGLFPPHDPNRVVWRFMNAVAARLRQQLPSRRIAFYACYGPMTAPPVDVRAAPGVVTVTCHVQSNRTRITDPDCPFNRAYLENIRRIKATGAELHCYEYTMFAGTPQPLAILSAPRVYHDLGYAGFHAECMGRDEQRRIIAWVLAQLAWDVSGDPDELLHTFCTQYYGAAGEDVLTVLRTVDASVRRLPKVILGSAGVAQSVMTADVIASGRGLLRQALGKTAGRQLERLRRFADTFEMLSRRAEYVRAAYEAMVARTGEATNRAADAMAAFEAFWDERDLSQTCSPSIRAGAGRFATTVQQIDGAPRPCASKELAEAGEDELLAAMFCRSGTVPIPQQVHILPEMWRFRPDIRRSGRQAWTAVGFDDTQWPCISTWNFYERQGFDRYDGAFCYRLTFRAPPFPEAASVLLRIGALDDEGEVYVNGQLVHRRLHLSPDDWQSSFAVDITKQLKRDELNTIAVYGNDEYGVGGVWKPCGLYAE